MDTTTVITVIGSVAGIIGSLGTLIIWMTNKLDGDIKGLSSRMDAQGTRMDAQGSRIDQLYVMFIDLVKDKK